MTEKLTLDSNVTVTKPILDQLATVDMVSTFMDTNLITIVAFLALLSTQLIYSLMLSDVEERTFEFGMLRALGFNTKNVVTTVFVQAILFAVPGLIIGLVFAGVLNAGMRHVLYTLVQNTSSYWLSTSAILIGCGIGIVIPIISNILPI